MEKTEISKISILKITNSMVFFLIHLSFSKTKDNLVQKDTEIIISWKITKCIVIFWKKFDFLQTIFVITTKYFIHKTAVLLFFYWKMYVCKLIQSADVTILFLNYDLWVNRKLQIALKNSGKKFGFLQTMQYRCIYKLLCKFSDKGFVIFGKYLRKLCVCVCVFYWIGHASVHTTCAFSTLFLV